MPEKEREDEMKRGVRSGAVKEIRRQRTKKAKQPLKSCTEEAEEMVTNGT